MRDARSQAARFASLLATLDPDDPVLERFCTAGQLMLDADGAAITLSYGTANRHTISSSSPLALMIEDAQEVTGEGPGFDAQRSGAVVAGTFGTLGSTPWPLLEDAIAALEFSGTILALPIRVQGSSLGILVAHRLLTSLTFDDETAAFLGSSLGAALLDELRPDELERELTDDWPTKAVVHQATGMVMAQLAVSPVDGLALMRAHAYSEGVSLIETAVGVVDREIRFDDLATGGS
jgi:hypothetical protein